MNEPVWEVVGGADRGGILVRMGVETTSPEADGRLSTGAYVKQLDLVSGRLHYEKLTGTGPAEGWVSISAYGKVLLEEVSFKPSAEIPYHLPLVDSPTHADELTVEAGFVRRIAEDPLCSWFPLRQLLPRGPRRPVLCVGPPSAKAADWAAPDAFGAWGDSEATGNALAQLARLSDDELFIAEAPAEVAALTLDGWAAKLAPRLVERLAGSPWAAVGVSVGVWLLVSFLSALQRLGQEGLQAVRQCECLHLVGFPPPPARGLDFGRPDGLEDVDWQLCCSMKPAANFRVPNNVAVYHLGGDGSLAVSQDRLSEWFKLQPSLLDGATKGAYPLFGLQGDHGVLKHPWRRTELYWALANKLWASMAPKPAYGVDLSMPAAEVPRKLLENYQLAAVQLGHGSRKVSLFDESDLLLQELDSLPYFVRIPNVMMLNGRFGCQENWTAGDTAGSIGLDIRMYWDKGSRLPGAEDWPVGCKIVCAVRFGNQAGIHVCPGSQAGVHGGAIQSVMDEVTAQCVRIWVQPSCTTRTISHQISGQVLRHMSYKCECEIESVKNQNCIYVSRGKLIDPVGKVVCISRSEMVDFDRMHTLQQQHSFTAL